MSGSSKGYTSKRKYSPTEERLNILSHGLGFLLAIPATAMLIIKASLHGDAWQIVSVSIYGASMITLYLASTLYHSAREPERRHKLNVFDHASIYLLIAGTYTPFLLVTLRGPWGWSLFGVIWAAALGGIIFKIFYTGKFDVVSTIAYVVMGSIVLVAIKPLVANLSLPGLYWLLAGGISYIIGAVLYLQHKMPFHHAIFHLFVLGGSVCHYIAVYSYVLK
ncbi:MAG TPA: hemolysin III family protein [Bacteroidetes bacterium]|nr:hemolysin III family protein [Bacteroidota bacterium]